MYKSESKINILFFKKYNKYNKVQKQNKTANALNISGL